MFYNLVSTVVSLVLSIGLLSGCASLRGEQKTAAVAKPAIESSVQEDAKTNVAKQIDDAISNGDCNRAIELIDYAIQNDLVERGELLYKRGKCLFDSGKLDEAKAALEDSFLNYPDSAWNAKAYDLLMQVEKERAKQRMKSASGPIGRLQGMFEQWRKADETSRKSMLASIESFIDENLSLDDLATFVMIPPAEPELASPLLMRAALMYYHIGDLKKSRQCIDSLSKICADSSCKWHERWQSLIATMDSTRNTDTKAVGVILPMSGRYKKVGKVLLDAVKLAFGEVGKKSGKYKLIVCDNKSSSVVARECVDDLVLNGNVIAILGPAASEAAYFAALRAQWFGVPIITLSSKEGIPDLGPYVFRMALTMKQQAESVAYYAVKQLGLKKFAIMYPMDPYGISLMNYFWDAAVRAGKELDPPVDVRITAIEAYPNGISDFTGYVRRMVGRLYPKMRYEYIKFKREEREKYSDDYHWRRALEKFLRQLPPIVDFDAVFIPDTARNVSMIIPALAYEGLDMHTTKKWKIQQIRNRATQIKHRIKLVWLLGTSAWNNPKLRERAGEFVEEAVFCDAFFPNADSELVKSFVEEYQKRFSRMPSTREVLAYEAGRFLNLLLDKKAPKTRKELRDALLSTKDLEGVTGKLVFLPNGEFDLKPVMLSFYDQEIVPADQISQENRRDVIYPLKKKEGEDGKDVGN